MPKNKILIIGDALIDEHLYCSVDRLSPEAPIPVALWKYSQRTLGGAANVAAYISNAGIPCIFMYKSYNASQGEFAIDELLDERQIEHYKLFMGKKSHSDVPIKQRIWAKDKSRAQQICRLDLEDSESPNEFLANEWIRLIIKTCENNSIKIVTFVDYNKGTLTDYIIQRLADYFKSKNILTTLDPKRPSWYKIKNLFAIKPNGREMEQTNVSAKECSTFIEDTYLINTVGGAGVKCWKNGDELFSYPSLATKVVDVCGLGDGFNALINIALYNGLSIEQAVIAGNRSAYYGIQHPGTYVLSSSEISECIEFAKSFTGEP